jgi:TonB family protein
MRAALLLASLAFSSLIQADMLDALKHYDEKDYPKASQEFSELLPLGNELAAFNLAVMFYKGEGTKADQVKALAYFQLADALGDSRAAALSKSVSAKLSAEQQQQATEQFQSLLNKVQIRDLHDDEVDLTDLPEVISRRAPDYPVDAARKGTFGYTVMKYLIDEQGNVNTVEVLGSFPDKSFNKSSIRAMKSWKYAATGQKHAGKVMLHYSLGPLQHQQVKQFMQQHKLMEYAVAGSPQHQFLLGTLLDMLATNSSYFVQSDKNQALDPAAELPQQFFKRKSGFSTTIEGFSGSAMVKTDAKGKVTEVLNADKMSKQRATALLVGKELDEDASNNFFRLWADPGKKVSITPVAYVSELHTGSYWWTMAAKNGNLEAQRQLAMLSETWENYLLQANDPQVQAWNGVRKILQGNKVEGQLLLDKAIAQNYQMAAELKAAL